MTAKEYNQRRAAAIEALKAGGYLPFVDEGEPLEGQILLWQKNHGLSPDGRLGPATEARLKEVYRPPFTAVDVVNRALSVLGKGWRYRLGAGKGKPDPKRVPAGAVGVEADCTGYAWWATQRVQTAILDSDTFGPRTEEPLPGCAVWHNARKPAKYGHAGIVIKVHDDGDYDTLDCSPTDPKPRGGAIRQITRAANFWKGKGSGSDVVFRMPANLKG